VVGEFFVALCAKEGGGFLDQVLVLSFENILLASEMEI